jgi:hypothetical protein
MKVRKYFLSASVGLCLGFGILATTSVTARATIVFSQPEADFSGTPYTINFGNGAATYTFTDIYDPLAGPFTVAAVSTGGHCNGKFLSRTTNRFSARDGGRRDWLRICAASRRHGHPILNI